MPKSKVHFLWSHRAPVKQFRTGVSLHSHTLHSKESLAFIPRYMSCAPLLDFAIRQQRRRYKAISGRELDFSRAFWRPPLGPKEAYDLEKRQIEKLDRNGLVSLTDHDDIQAGSLLGAVELEIPISVEWTIPLGPSFLHLGIHNLPPNSAPAIMQELARFTADPQASRLAELLALLDDFKETLLVLNHPMWDEAKIGTLEHERLATLFLEQYGERIHALELNGLRPWKENRRVISLAEHSGHVLISGGDRHGVEPNANINLTNAGTFAEFVAEVRKDGFSDVLFLPQYREPIRLRMIETMCDIVRDYPEFPLGRRFWNERVFYRKEDGSIRPLSEIWSVDPWPVQWFLRGLRAIRNSSQVRGALRMALAEAPEAGL